MIARKGSSPKERVNPWARRGLFISMGERAYTKRAAKSISGSLCIYSVVSGFPCLLLVPVGAEHTQVAAVAPLSVLLSSGEELSSLLWVLLHHTGEM